MPTLRFGIDIVDLSDTAGHHPRFIDRALTPEEQAEAWKGLPAEPLAKDDQRRNKALWRFWAAKEAAYKAYSQGEKRPFHPRDWVVDLKAGRVVYGKDVFGLLTSAEGSHVRAACFAAEGSRRDDIALHEALHEALDPIQSRNQSELARSLLRELCRKHLGSAALLSTQGRPQIKDPGAAVSISHHGRWVYAAVALLSPPDRSSPAD